MEMKKSLDQFTSLKYKGYCRSQLPPGEGRTMDDFANYAKFFICQQAKVLWNDPIWDTYTIEGIIVEYYAYLFELDGKLRKEFEASIDAELTFMERKFTIG